MILEELRMEGAALPQEAAVESDDPLVTVIS